ncbi:MAG TPA: nucleotidyltransferase family protein [Bacteroidota bacterium]|nr:nucleotidyltransferase family protein [Bacteroidota bacterium]
MNVAAVLLAAGASTRLGSPKQLVHTHGESLLRRTARRLSASHASEVCVVLGYNAAGMEGQLAGLPLRVTINPLWREGIGSSIRHGIASLAPGTDGALIVVCDQPRISTEHLDALIDAFAHAPDRPVASGYGGSAGVPALFPRSLFPELLLLHGDRGAKSVLLAHAGALTTLPWPDGAFDVDAEPDLFPRL